MKIDNAQIFLGSSHSFARKQTIEESLVEGTSRPGTQWSEDNLESGLSYHRSESTSRIESSAQSQLAMLSRNAQRNPDAGRFVPRLALELGARPIEPGPMSKQPAPEISSNEISVDDNLETTPTADAKLQTLIAMIEMITGKKFKILHAEDIQALQKVDTETAEQTAEETVPTEAEWGLVYHYEEHIQESEHTQFTAQGIISTADGQEIQIDLELNMSRQFVQHTNIDIIAGAGRLKDPLVINFNGAAAELTETKFSFDIDADGTDDQISFVGPNSGFLALDKNADNTINNGRELFGALSGNGFEDLAQYDDDNNGFIDEADSVYSKLRIWTRDHEGNDQLMALGQANVGAIYLGHNNTPFEIKTTDNQLQGVVRNSGIYIGDDGSTGTIQQLDLVV